MTNYTISCIIPTYNRANMVCDAIDSALAQTYPCHEIIVVDDGSTDNTEEILRERFGKKILYLKQENRGVSAARNRGIKEATGEWIALLDSDDLWLPEKTERQVDILLQNPNIMVCYSAAQSIDCNNNYKPLFFDASGNSKDIMLRSLYGCPVKTQTVVINRHCFEICGMFDNSLKNAEDWDLFARIALHFDFIACTDVLVTVRKHDSNMTNDIDRMAETDIDLIDKILNYSECECYRPLRNKILSQKASDIGLQLYYNHEQFKSRKWLKLALGYAPLNIPLWVYIIKSYFPNNLLKIIRYIKHTN